MMTFIKGSPSEPKCGFSKQLIQILSEYKNIKYEYYDILQNDKVRQGLKTFSNWQTYPQVYVNGDLIGGIDIVEVSWAYDEQKARQNRELFLLSKSGQIPS